MGPALLPAPASYAPNSVGLSLSAGHLIAGIVENLAGVSFVALAAALTFHLAKMAAEARSWHNIVVHAYPGRQIGFRTTLGAFVGGTGASAVLPARAGEALRVGLVRRRLPGSSVTTISATVLLEAGLEIVLGVGVIAVALFAGRSLGAWWSPTVDEAPALLAIAFLLAVLLVVRWQWPRLQAPVRRFVLGCSIMRAPAQLVQGVISWKLVAWTLRFASVYLFLVAFHVPATLWATILVVAAQHVAALIPLMPGNAGTQQAAIVAALAGTAAAAPALAFGIGMQAATTLVDVLVGATAIAFVAGGPELRRAMRR
jgi:uncharacterized membrane protein YbhN (UPF0104 family)